MIKTLQNNLITTLCLIFSIIVIYILSQDLLELAHLKSTLHILEHTQTIKENQLTQYLEIKSPSLSPKLLNPSETLITFAKFCESSHLLLKKLQIKKYKPKTEDLVEISLKSCGNYAFIIDFLNQLNSLPYLIDFKAFKIAKTHLQKPLEISLELLLSTSYLPTAPAIPSSTSCSVVIPSAFCSAVIPRSAATRDLSSLPRLRGDSLAKSAPRNDSVDCAHQDNIASPFLIKRITGKIEIPAHITGNKSIPNQCIQLLSVEDDDSGTCILQKKLEYSASIE